MGVTIKHWNLTSHAGGIMGYFGDIMRTYWVSGKINWTELVGNNGSLVNFIFLPVWCEYINLVRYRGIISEMFCLSFALRLQPAGVSTTWGKLFGMQRPERRHISLDGLKWLAGFEQGHI